VPRHADDDNIDSAANDYDHHDDNDHPLDARLFFDNHAGPMPL
jgi:hypothetical protein